MGLKNYFLPTVQMCAYVTLEVYNILGGKVATLANEVKSAGHYEVAFDGSNFASGIYFYRMTTQSFNEVKQMVLLK